MKKLFNWYLHNVTEEITSAVSSLQRFGAIKDVLRFVTILEEMRTKLDYDI